MHHINSVVCILGENICVWTKRERTCEAIRRDKKQKEFPLPLVGGRARKKVIPTRVGCQGDLKSCVVVVVKILKIIVL